MPRMDAIFTLFIVMTLEEGPNFRHAALSRYASEGAFDWR
jgi:hypothetical protein